MSARNRVTSKLDELLERESILDEVLDGGGGLRHQDINELRIGEVFAEAKSVCPKQFVGVLDLLSFLNRCESLMVSE